MPVTMSGGGDSEWRAQSDCAPRESTFGEKDIITRVIKDTGESQAQCGGALCV